MTFINRKVVCWRILIACRLTPFLTHTIPAFVLPVISLEIKSRVTGLINFTMRTSSISQEATYRANGEQMSIWMSGIVF